MSEKLQEQKELLRKIKVMSNSKRFQILLLTQDKTLSITELSSKLKLSYTKCADYVTMLEKEGLVSKNKEGKEIKVQSKVKLSSKKVEIL